MKNRVALVAAAAAASSFAMFGAGMPAAHAAETKTSVQTVDFDLGDLDSSGTAQLDQFDQSLGDLVSVKIATEVTMDLTTCTTNRSEEATTVSAGSASGSASLTFVGAATTADAALSIPGTELAAFGEGSTDGCADWQQAGGDPAVQPVGDNSSLRTASKTDTWSATLTGDATAPYVGDGTIGFDYAASSASNLGQPSEWTIVFLANGAGKATVTYTYEPKEIGGIDDGNPPPDEVDSEGLPNTGGPDAWLMYLGAGLVVVGAGLVMVRRPHSA